MKTPALSLAAAGITFFVASCTAPWASRIQEDPAAYARLNNRDKSLVQRGEVATGMSREGVKLAWGAPDRQTTEVLDGVSCEKWIYTGYLPTYGYRIHTVRPNQPPGIRFSGPLLVGETSTGNQVLGQVRDGYFRDGNLVAWDVSQ